MCLVRGHNAGHVPSSNWFLGPLVDVGNFVNVDPSNIPSRAVCLMQCLAGTAIAETGFYFGHRVLREFCLVGKAPWGVFACVRVYVCVCVGGIGCAGRESGLCRVCVSLLCSPWLTTSRPCRHQDHVPVAQATPRVH
jgi:hypothetical protein